MLSKIIMEEKLEEIYLAIKQNRAKCTDLGVLTGLSGLALFQFYYGKYLDDDRIADEGLETIELCIEKINQGYNFPTYCNGIAGMCWSIQHLKKEDFLDEDCEDLLSQFDDSLYNQMLFEFSKGNYDFLHGALGYAFYFLGRYKHTKDLDLKNRYKSYLDESIIKLKELSEPEEDFIKWESTLDFKEETKGYNLSLSHGMSSILNFLGRLWEFEVFKKSTDPLLHGCMRYILSFEKDDSSNLSLFPSWVQKNVPNVYNSRVAWCYGDLGIGLSLLRASSCLGDPILKDHAMEILKRTSKRKTGEKTLVVDAGICHGSYGNAKIYHHINVRSNEPFFKESHKFWIADGTQRAIHTDGHAGYRQWNPLEKSWTSELCLLEGVAGIGLVMIDTLSPEPNTWDECLLLS